LDAESQAQLVLIATGAVLLLAIVVTLLASRSITKPLARLVGEAEDMASTRLPNTVQDILDAPLGDDVAMPELAEVDRSGGYEIAEVATALNTVQASAAELAVEQAVLRRNIADSFVNLGRRNQNLLNRQLESITEMERQESDPEELQKLFTLDHLATRMRRNAESLLLLAGLEPLRQWSAPVALIDVLRGQRHGRGLRPSRHRGARPGDDQRHRRRRPHPPRGRAARERPQLLAPGRRRDHRPGPTTATCWPSSTTASA
jgi:hypothetical protein